MCFSVSISAMKIPLYGRENETSWLLKGVLCSAVVQKLPILTWIYGRSGMGKTALLNAFKSECLQEHKSQVIIIHPDTESAMFGVEMFAESMFRSAQACPVVWGKSAARMGDQFSQIFASIRGSESPVAVAYSSQGKIAPKSFNENANKKDPSGYKLSEVCLKTFTKLFEEVSAEEWGPPEAASIIFCFDEFANYAPSVKKWIGSVLIQAMISSDRMPKIRLVLTGRESLKLTGQADYFKFTLGRIVEYELGALSRSACIKWLIAIGIDPDLIDELMEQTKGVPGRIVKLLGDEKCIAGMERSFGEEDLAFAVTAKERRWLHAVAVLEYIDLESLSVLLSEKESKLAIEWLKNRTEIKENTSVDSVKPPSIFLRSTFRHRILRECANRYPTRDKEFRMKIAIQKRLQEKVPSLKHREYLKQLIAIEPFDLEMIDKIYGGYE
jgi:hypothetical protein